MDMNRGWCWRSTDQYGFAESLYTGSTLVFSNGSQWIYILLLVGYVWKDQDIQEEGSEFGISKFSYIN